MDNNSNQASHVTKIPFKICHVQKHVSCVSCVIICNWNNGSIHGRLSNGFYFYFLILNFSSAKFAFQYTNQRRKSGWWIQGNSVSPALGQRWRTWFWAHNWWRKVSNGGTVCHKSVEIFCDWHYMYLSNFMYWIQIDPNYSTAVLSFICRCISSI